MTELHRAHPSRKQRRAAGKQARTVAARGSHRRWHPAADRPDPLELLQQQDATREPDLVPVRHGRMMVSPFTFYRGGAKIMAADLSATPTAGLWVQLCGDAHLSNFGGFATPERTLVFDVNDFDESLPGPFEYDVKRLAASFTVAARNNAYSKPDVTAITAASVAAYRTAMARFARMGLLDIWYARMSEQTFLQLTGAAGAGMTRKQERSMADEAHKHLGQAATRENLQELSQLAERVDGQYRIRSQPPLLIPTRDLSAAFGTRETIKELVHDRLQTYRTSLNDDRRRLLERYQVLDEARKVVGVGSVGTRAFIVLLQGQDTRDPLFLQVKQATASVLEDHLPPSSYANPGQRVVQGQRIMQAASDIFLGWTDGAADGRHYYWRQLRDMKTSANVEAMTAAGMTRYADACGWTLARAHARSGDPVAIAAYLGTSNTFDKAITDFALRYANQNERDYHQFTNAIRSGQLAAVQGV